MTGDCTPKYVVIGGGPAGVIAAESLRKANKSAAVMIIGDESEPHYSRMALPYYLTERINEAGTYLRKDTAHNDNLGIKVLCDRVTSIDSSKKKLSLQSGEQIAYDKLLIATGSSPIVPPINGMDLPKVHSCWTLEDGRNIMKHAKSGANVVLMGAGFIGSIILESLALRNVNLSVIEMGDRMVPRMMDQTAGNLIKKWCVNKGINVLTSTKVEEIKANGDALQVMLDNGTVLDADLVISATGVMPNIGFLKGSGIKTDVGVLVNDHLQSSVNDIYAAGDVCQGQDFSTGEYSVQAIQPTAADHGRISAMNMSGKDICHQGSVNMNVLDTMGLISSSYGLWMGVDGGDSATLCDEDRYRYISLKFEDDILVGAQSLGLTQHVGVLRGLIQTKLKLGKWKNHLLQDPTRIMEAYLGATQSVGHNIGLI